MTTPGTMLNYSRFHAIVSARPLHAHGPPVISEGLYRLPYEPWGSQSHNEKRKREDSDPGPSTGKKATKRSSEDEGNSGREVSKAAFVQILVMKTSDSHSLRRITVIAQLSWLL